MSDDTLAPGLVTDLLRARLDDDDEAAEDALALAEERGAGVVPDVLAAFAHARLLPENQRRAVAACAAEVVVASDAPEAWEALFRDVAATSPDDPQAELSDLLDVVEERDWCELAFPLRAAAIAEGDVGLRRVAAYLLSLAEPGTPGVYEALCADHDTDPEYALADLCAHGDTRAADLLRAALRSPDELLEIDRTDLWRASTVAVALLDWDVDLAADERLWAEAAIVAQCAELELDNDELRAELEHNLQVAAELRRHIPGRLRPARAPGRVGPNEPCPCGSGRKSKRCCG